MADAQNPRKRSRQKVQVRRTEQKLDEITTERKVHHRAKIFQSLQNFLKEIMGLTARAKAIDLPGPPSLSEVSAWSSWRSRRKDAMRKRLNDLEQANPNLSQAEIDRLKKLELVKLRQTVVGVAFTSPELSSAASVGLAVKKALEQDLQASGFNRFTFEWNATSLTASQWNAAALAILINHWMPWAKNQNLERIDADIALVRKGMETWIHNQGEERKKSRQQPESIANRRKANKINAQKRKVSHIDIFNFITTPYGSAVY